MPHFDPEQMLAWTGGRWCGMPARALTGFGVDSRRIREGQVFVALKTEKRDGHDYVESARQSGASAALVSRPVPTSLIAQLVVDDPLEALQAIARGHREAFKGKVVGVTGSAGKTSTKELVSLLLGGDASGVLATEGNLNNHIGVALTLTRLDPARHRLAVIEAGISGPGEMAVLARMIQPDLALTTLVGPAHLEELGGLEGVAREKAVLSKAVRKGGLSVFPASCEAYPPFRDLAESGALVLERGDMPDGGGQESGRAYYSCEHGAEATRVSVEVGRFPSIQLVLPRTTDGMACNAALAACAATKLGVSRAEIEERISLWRPVQLRGEWKISEGRRLFLDCYNANPASMADALGAFRAVAPAEDPRLYVIGCMEELGADAPSYHRQLGKSLSLRSNDLAVVVGGQADSVLKGALEAGAQTSQVEVVPTIEGLEARLAEFRGSVFVKGSRRYQLERAFLGAEHAEASHA